MAALFFALFRSDLGGVGAAGGGGYASGSEGGVK